MVHCLIADGDEKDRKRIKEKAEEAGYATDEASNGISALKLFRRKEYDIVILDAYLPELDGINVCRQIRKLSGVPVIFLTARSKESDRLNGFLAGADDYVLKPFYVSELMMRIGVILNRCNNKNVRTAIYAEGLSIHLNARAVYVDENQVALSPREYDLLVFLLENRNIALSRDTILNQVWGDDFEGTDRTVDTHIRILREHMKPYGNKIVTVWGIGYKFEG